MEPIKVLIMCQRKKSFDYSIPTGKELSHAASVDITVKKIEHYLCDYYGTRNIDIEYMIKYTSQENDMYEADYKIWFDPTSKDTETRLKSYQFIEKHCGYYDMIMLQTCPIPHFINNFKYLPWMIKPDGVLTVKAFSAYEPRVVDIKSSFPDVNNDLMKYFNNKDIDTYNVINKEE
jgi:hypothetical protein